MKNNPIYIHDPKATQSVVRVAPYQNFVVQFSSLSNIVDFHYASEFFDLVEERGFDGGGKSYTFKQIHPQLFLWSEYSSVFLGEIVITRQNGQSCISVVLAGKKNPYNILTVVNPSGEVVRLNASQILEVVLTELLPVDKRYTIVGGDYGLMYIIFAETYLNPTTLKSDRILSSDGDILPVVPRGIGPYEHHFWFQPIQVNPPLPRGTYDGGHINFGASWKVNLEVNMRRKDSKRKKNNKPLVHIPSKTICLHRKNVAVEQMTAEDWADGCNTLEIIGINKVLTTKDGKAVVYGPQAWGKLHDTEKRTSYYSGIIEQARSR